MAHHKVYGQDRPGVEADENNQATTFGLLEQESKGTVRLFYLATLLVNSFKTENNVFFIDEIDTSLHPLLLEFIIKQVDSQQTNKVATQLVYSSHASHLLSESAQLRKDQIWLTDKNNQEETELKCLSEHKIEEGSDIAKDYLIGRFGGIPNLDLDDY